jgi:hypothetical protein
MAETLRPLILGLGGTPRQGSTTERALALSLSAAAAEGADIIMIAGQDLMLRMYTPDNAERTAGRKRLIDAFRRCSGLVIASPAYHGSLRRPRRGPRCVRLGLASRGADVGRPSFDCACASRLADAAWRCAQYVGTVVRRRRTVPRPLVQIAARNGWATEILRTCRTVGPCGERRHRRERPNGQGMIPHLESVYRPFLPK